MRPSDPESVRSLRLAQRLAVTSLVANVALAAGNVVVGLLAGSPSVVATGVEFAGDAATSALLYAGFLIAGRPADSDHPYGHGRAETVVGLVLGVLLVLTGGGISSQSMRYYDLQHPPPATSGVYTLLAAMAVKAVLMATKFRVGRTIRSAALVADAWNDSVDILSSATALTALGLTLYDPTRFLAADHFGGFAVGLLVIITGLGVARDTSLQLMDTMPPQDLMDRIRASAHRVAHVRGVEKCWARKTGLRYHVDLHLEVEASMTVAEAHGVAEQVRHRIRHDVPEISDVLVHVEPAPPSAGPGR